MAESPALPFRPLAPVADLQYHCSFVTSLTRAFLQLTELRKLLTIFWDITPRSMVNAYRRFGTTSRDTFRVQE
jgi:hypothetical protein